MRRFLPTAESVRSNRWVAWLGPVLSHPQLWHLNRRSVALGVAVGLFFGLLVPLGQIPFAAVASVLLRANLIVSVASTLVTNPLTFAPIYLLAYRIGTALTGEAADADAVAALAEPPEEVELIPAGWAERFLAIGKPLAIGLLVLACGTAPVAYFAVLGIWRLAAAVAWRSRRRSGQK